MLGVTDESTYKSNGVSHADGSYRNCGVSIPIAFVYTSDGRQVYLSKGDIRSVIIDLNLNKVEYL